MDAPENPEPLSRLDKQMAPSDCSTARLQWHHPDASPFRLTGFPWIREDKVYRRLPLAQRAGLPEPVDRLADCTAGGQVSFQTDSDQVAVRVTLAGPADMNHMPATGQCGFDLYLGAHPGWHYHSTSVYDRLLSSYEALLFDHPERKMRRFLINFPLYQGVKALRIGLHPEASIHPPTPFARKGRVVVYGTSVTQGGCASRPGMAWTNILSRRLNTEFVNLGFSGSGRGEPDVIRKMAAVARPILFVLDYEANTTGDLAQTLPEAIRILRIDHPTTPILVISRTAFAKDLTHPETLKLREDNRELQQEAVRRSRQGGDRHIHFLDGSSLFGPDFDECTVDGVHPNDLGFMRIARGVEPAIRSLLESRDQAG